MKKVFMFVFAVVVVLHLSGMTTYAQGKGQGRSQGRPSAAAPSHDTMQKGKAEHKEQKAEHKERKAEHKEDKAEHKEEKREHKAEHREDKFEDRLERNPQLKGKIEGMLPSGVSMKDAAHGFKNQGQFVAALHVSKNLNIPFRDLKAKMTGSNSMSLGQAIHELKPDMPESKARQEARKAEKQARETEKTKTTT